VARATGGGRRLPRRLARVVAAVALCAVFLSVPVFMVLGSLRMPGLPPPDGWEWLPDPWWWDNYDAVSRFLPEWGLAVKNSILVVLLAVPVTVLVGSWAGFAIATSPPRRRRRLVAVSLMALLVPVSTLWVPRFTVYRWLGITDSLLAVAAPALLATTPFYVLLFALAYWRIPPSLFDAARVEGSSSLRTWWTVAVPLGRPVLFAVAMLAFTYHWSNLMDPLLYVSSPDLVTLPIALTRLQAFEPTNFPLLLAGAVMTTVPALIAFALAQRAFLVDTVEGST
jgi:multiple sugar transport system permease protein